MVNVIIFSEMYSSEHSVFDNNIAQPKRHNLQCSSYEGQNQLHNNQNTAASNKKSKDAVP